jgi:hypothetical protein
MTNVKILNDNHAFASEWRTNNWLHNNKRRAGLRRRGLEVLSDGSIITAGRKDRNGGQGAVTRWSVTGQPIWFFGQNHNENRDVSVDESGGYVFAGNNNGDIMMLDLGTGEEIWRKQNYFSGACYGSAFAGGYLFATGSNNDDGLVKFDVDTGDVLNSEYTGTTNYVRDWTLAGYGSDLYYVIDQTIYQRDAETFSDNTSASLNNTGNYVHVNENGVYVRTNGLEKWDLGLTSRSYHNTQGDPDIIDTHEDLVLGENEYYNEKDGKYISTLNNRCSGFYLDGTGITQHASDGWGRFDLRIQRRVFGRVRSVNSNSSWNSNWSTVHMNGNDLRLYCTDRNNLSVYLQDEYSPGNDGGNYRVGREYVLNAEFDNKDNIFITLTTGGKIFSYTERGVERWFHKLTSESALSMAPDDDGGVFIGTSAGNLIHLDSDGNEEWSIDHFNAPINRLVKGEDSLYICSKKEIREVTRLDGVEVWTHTSDDWVYDITIGPDSNIYFASDDGEIKELDGGQFVDSYDPFPKLQYRDRRPTALEYRDEFFYMGTTQGGVRKLSKTLTPAWSYQYSNEETVWDVAPRESMVGYNDSYEGKWSCQNQKVFQAERKTRVYFVTIEPMYMVLNGETLDEFEDSNDQKYTEH